MNWLLERVSKNEGMTASVDLFDSSGVLLLPKGYPITKSIFDINGRFISREVYADLTKDLTMFIMRLEIINTG